MFLKFESIIMYNLKELNSKQIINILKTLLTSLQNKNISIVF